MITRLDLATRQESQLDAAWLSDYMAGTCAQQDRSKAALSRARDRLRTERLLSTKSGAAFCPYCLQPLASDYGGSLHRQSCEARYLADWIKERPGSREEQAMLERHLERARHVGH